MEGRESRHVMGTQGRNMMVVFGFLNCEVILFTYDRGSWKQRGAKTHFLREKLTFRSKRIEREKKKNSMRKKEVLPIAQV